MRLVGCDGGAVPAARTFLLQAESDEETFHWIQCLQNAIHAALNGPPGTTTKGLPENFLAREGAAGGGGDGVVGEETRLVNTVKKNEADPAQLLKVRSLPGNDVCAECSAKDAVWATINLGVALCIECSGIHRSLGVHYSKVRSLTLDKWEADSVEVFFFFAVRKAAFRADPVRRFCAGRPGMRAKLGNTGRNLILDFRDDRGNRNTKQAWINSKYVKKLYVGDGKDFLAGDTPDQVRLWRRAT
ncbi:MAG: hypothetical protein BJ554DRAFT_1125 [Olpidium bornovanus]|uniref:Uncharacterized protein n=1 Tax=Olpidium bornovanus TaxID=278681 RepID=A0A8H8DI14_9FUNG|nr:MAG: hypothetical protein BJ554DRAFT_1125 [Olpidium bornovanus]